MSNTQQANAFEALSSDDIADKVSGFIDYNHIVLQAYDYCRRNNLSDRMKVFCIDWNTMTLYARVEGTPQPV